MGGSTLEASWCLAAGCRPRPSRLAPAAWPGHPAGGAAVAPQTTPN
jgi:hypothetical protein